MIHSKIISFVATRHPARAREFYETTLGLKFVSDDPFAIVFDVHGTMLRVQKVQELSPAKHTVLGWEVPDIRARIQELASREFGLSAFRECRRMNWACGPRRRARRLHGLRTRMGICFR